MKRVYALESGNVLYQFYGDLPNRSCDAVCTKLSFGLEGGDTRKKSGVRKSSSGDHEYPSQI